MIKRVFSLLVLMAFTTSAALAQTIEATPAPKPPKPNFAPLKFMLGSWSCTAKSSRRPGPYKWTISYALDGTGYWLVGKSNQAAVSWFPYPIVGQDLITFDADTGRWADSYSDNLGNYDLTVSPGWVGSKIVWHDLAFAKGKDIATQTDLTWTKVSDTKISSNSGFTTVKGKSVSVTGVCLKQ